MCGGSCLHLFHQRDLKGNLQSKSPKEGGQWWRKTLMSRRHHKKKRIETTVGQLPAEIPLRDSSDGWRVHHSNSFLKLNSNYTVYLTKSSSQDYPTRTAKSQELKVKRSRKDVTLKKRRRLKRESVSLPLQVLQDVCCVQSDKYFTIFPSQGFFFFFEDQPSGLRRP